MPFLFEVKEMDGSHFFVKNQSIKVINLASNGLKDGCSGLIRKFAESNGKAVEMFLEGNRFGKNTKETLKFYENLVL